MTKRKKSSNKRPTQARPETVVSSALPLSMPAGITLIIVAAILAYLPSLNGGFIWDDNDVYVTKNQIIKASDGLYRFWCTTEPAEYYPVTNTTFWIEWRLWEMNSTGYHVTNLVLHILESLLILIILRKLSIPGALLAAMIFAVHPVNVESVAWIAQRKNLMAMFFFLLSILSYLKMEIPFGSHLAPRPSSLATCHLPLYYWLSLAAFLLAMLSKGSVAVLPVMLLGIIWWLRPLTRWDLMRTAPFFVVAVVLTRVNMWFQIHGTETVIRDASFTQRLLGAGSVAWFYLYKALMPVNLAFVYPQWNIEAGNSLWWLPLLATLAVTAVLWRYRNNGSRPLLFAWGFFCVALAPVMGFTDVYFMKFSLVADHYQHIPLVGVVALASAGFGTWHRMTRGRARSAAVVVAILAAGVLTAITWRQNGIYRDETTLYRDTLKKNPNCWMAHNNLGLNLLNVGRLQEATEHYVQALRIKPDYADAHNNLGATLFDTGRPTEAIAHYEQSLRLNPDFPEAHYNLGNALRQTGRLEEAIEHYKQALRLKPDYVEAHNNLGIILVQTGRPKEGIEHYQQALRLKPDYAYAHNNLGLALANTGRLEEAIEHYEQALWLKPDYAYAHNNLGLILSNIGRLEDAIKHYEQALRLKPDHAEAYYNLGAALVQTGRLEDAIAHYQQALQLKPDYVQAYYNLTVTYAQIGRPAEAIATARKALEVARSTGQMVQAKRFEDLLNSYSAGLPNVPNATPTSEIPTP